MESQKENLYQTIENHPGMSTNKVARIAGFESSDSQGNHKNWKAYELIKELEEEGRIIDKRTIKKRGIPCEWWVATEKK